ncbi:MAG: hypothetical protein EU530_01460 [Promethearchaeota archaeon]|nr:MAG: hypothetical protein EU530_01460 [Candidatus Lokiarchaeota archaeon]
MGVLKELKLKDLVTLLGTSCGIMSIILTIDGRYLWAAAAFIYFSMVFDLLDGIVAKRMNQANELGKILDSMSDLLCFGIAPAVLMYRAYTGGGAFPPFALMLFCAIFIIGAILRLTWFSISENKGYEGVTTPVTSSLILTLFFIDTFYGYFPDSGSLLGEIMKYIIPICMLILPYLNVSRFFVYGEGVRARENKRITFFLFLIMGFGLISSILTFFNHEITGLYIYVLCVSIAVMLFFYLGIGILNYIKRKKEMTKSNCIID